MAENLISYNATSTLDFGLGRFNNASVRSKYGWVAQNGSVPGEEYVELRFPSFQVVSGFHFHEAPFDTFSTTTLQVMYTEDPGYMGPYRYAETAAGDGATIFTVSEEEQGLCEAHDFHFNKTVYATALRIIPLTWPANEYNMDAPGLRVTPEVCG